MKKTLTFLFCIYTALLGGCSTTPEYFTDVERGKLHISKFHYSPSVKVTYGTESTGQYMMQKAGKGVVNCVRGGSVIGLVFSPLCALVGGTYGVAASGPEKNARQQGERLMRFINGDEIQQYLMESMHDYALKQEIKPELTGAEDLTGNESNTIKGVSHLANNNAIQIKAGIKEIALSRKEKGKKPGEDTVCISLEIEGKRHESGNVVTSKNFVTVDCKTINEWSRYSSADLLEQLKKAIKLVATRIMDNFVLMYYPDVDSNHKDLLLRYQAISKLYPPYVLAGTQPVMKEKPNHRLGAINNVGQASHRQEMDIPQVKSLQPELRWESFPMPWDKNLVARKPEIKDVRYDLRVYLADYERLFLELGINKVGKQVYAKSDLVEPKHVIKTPLIPCKTYYWTVRANFHMNDALRVTEWGGTYGKSRDPQWEKERYYNDKDHFFDSRTYYYMFSTPAGGNVETCKK